MKRGKITKMDKWDIPTSRPRLRGGNHHRQHIDSHGRFVRRPRFHHQPHQHKQPINGTHKRQSQTNQPHIGSGERPQTPPMELHGYFMAVLQKIFKSGIKKKNDRKVPPNPNIISLIAPAQKLEFISNFTEELSRQTTLYYELTHRYGQSNIKSPYDYGTINKDSRRPHREARAILY